MGVFRLGKSSGPQGTVEEKDEQRLKFCQSSAPWDEEGKQGKDWAVSKGGFTTWVLEKYLSLASVHLYSKYLLNSYYRYYIVLKEI